jgi:glycosyltransferase involved in cell wall biosynthesis
MEDVPYYFAVSRVVSRLRTSFKFDVIHAHFSYPDGWVAARLGRRFSVPVVITEHAPWRPWMDDYSLVRSKAKRAFDECAFHVGVSRSVQDETRHFVDDPGKIRVIPCGVDGSVFTLGTRPRQSNQVLFAGAIRQIKGLDILLRAMRILMDGGRQYKLVIVGDSYYKKYQDEYVRIRRMASDLDLQVNFVSGKPQVQLANYMQESSVLVLPSRKESLGMVLVEALACGTPVVATRCGGPEDIVTEQVGALVPPEDPEALARAIERIVEHPEQYKPSDLRSYALQKFSWQGITDQYLDLYRQAIALHRTQR